jgi:hypothetical protein
LNTSGALAGLLPAFTVVSSPVVKNTVVTETNTQELRIIFRNTPDTLLLLLLKPLSSTCRVFPHFFVDCRFGKMKGYSINNN